MISLVSMDSYSCWHVCKGGEDRNLAKSEEAPVPPDSTAKSEEAHVPPDSTAPARPPRRKKLMQERWVDDMFIQHARVDDILEDRAKG